MMMMELAMELFKIWSVLAFSVGLAIVIPALLDR